jgi:hypothetical protein
MFCAKLVSYIVQIIGFIGNLIVEIIRSIIWICTNLYVGMTSKNDKKTQTTIFNVS